MSTEVEHFAQYGFEVPNFEAEILKEINGLYIGYVIKGGARAISWNKDGEVFDMANTGGRDYSLKPIQKSDEQIAKETFNTWYKKEFPRSGLYCIKAMLETAWRNGMDVQKNIEDYR